MGDILVGTASWADKSLLDSRRFYPKEAKTAEARLRYYATHFALVEVDSSYYAIPAPQVAEFWAQRTPQSFVFDLKAFRIFTQHQTPPQALPKEVVARHLPYLALLPAPDQQDLGQHLLFVGVAGVTGAEVVQHMIAQMPVISIRGAPDASCGHDDWEAGIPHDWQKALRAL